MWNFSDFNYLFVSYLRVTVYSVSSSKKLAITCNAVMNNGLSLRNREREEREMYLMCGD